jgi:CelD/BcsL family acetyltransferase involved in cellulose biosynthesis
MKVRLVTSLREFDALALIWEEVTQESGQASPFLSHDWFACCWRTAGPERQREVGLVEDASGPGALLPLMRWKARVRGLPVRMVGLLDSPDTPFADFPVAGAFEEVIGTFLDSLRERRDWDVLSLQKLPVHSRTVRALQAALLGQFPWRELGREHSPYLTISESWEEFFRQKTQRFRKTYRNIENRIQRDGAVTVEEHREVDPDGPVFAEALEVSRQSWKGPRTLAMATMQGMPRFFRELTQRASAKGWLHLWILRLNGRAVATEYQIGANGSLHDLRADFDSALADLSPGTCLSLRIIRSLFEQRSVREYDMGPGANPYKLRCATGVHETLALEVYARTAYGRLLHGIETHLVPVARRWRERVGA